MQETEATITTSRRSKRLRVAERRSRSISSLIVDFLLDVGVRLRDVGLGLVVVVVGDEVLDGVLGEEGLELLVELGGQGLVVGEDQGGAVHLREHRGDGEGLAAAGDPEQHLVLVAALEALRRARRWRGAGRPCGSKSLTSSKWVSACAGARRTAPPDAAGLTGGPPGGVRRGSRSQPRPPGTRSKLPRGEPRHKRRRRLLLESASERGQAWRTRRPRSSTHRRISRASSRARTRSCYGRFKGEIALSGRLVLGEGARVEATVSADAAEVAGEMKGDVRARSVTLTEKARVQGTVDARVLVVREGAWLSGSVSAGEGASKGAPRRRRRRRRRPLGDRPLPATRETRRAREASRAGRAARLRAARRRRGRDRAGGRPSSRRARATSPSSPTRATPLTSRPRGPRAVILAPGHEASAALPRLRQPLPRLRPRGGAPPAAARAPRPGCTRPRRWTPRPSSARACTWARSRSSGRGVRVGARTVAPPARGALRGRRRSARTACSTRACRCASAAGSGAGSSCRTAR